jgi:hypothetical protein
MNKSLGILLGVALAFVDALPKLLPGGGDK